MANKITCTCGHSWNKSDSSKKDAMVCHICGKNNMKNGGWLNKYNDVPEAQNGRAVSDETRVKPIVTDKPINRETVKSTNKSYRMSPQEALLNKLKGKKLKESQDRLNKTAEKITAVGSLSPNPLVSIPSAIGNLALGITGASTPGDAGLDYMGVFGSAATPNSARSFKKIARRLPFFKGINAVDALSDIFEFTPSEDLPKKQDGGWLDKFEAPEAQNGIEGTMGGLTDKGFNYNGAWGGPSMQDGGLTFLEPTSRKLPMGHVIPMSDPSTELAISVGGEDGEPAYLIPSFKYGKYLIDKDAKAEFRKTGEHLGGPFKTWQEADEWERTVRHPYVEKGQNIPTPLKRWGKDFAMGGSLPGSVGFTYARTQGAAPSNGPYAKKTLASAQNGKPIKKREDFEPWWNWASKKAGDVDNRQDAFGTLGDLYAYYAGQPLHYNTLEHSQYKPTNAKNPNASYISINDPKFKQEVFDKYQDVFIKGKLKTGDVNKGEHPWHNEEKINDNTYAVSGYTRPTKEELEEARKQKVSPTFIKGKNYVSNAIGRYFISKGKDDKGEYISYYDVFDEGSGPDGGGMGETLGLTKPFEIYDRIYLDPKTGKPKMQNGGEMKFYQEGLDWKPRNISRDGSEIPQAQLGLHMLTPDYSQVGENIMEMLSVPQKALTKLISGKYQAPSEAMGIKNKVGAIATDILLDPANLVGGTAATKIAKGVKATKAVNTAVKTTKPTTISSSVNKVKNLEDLKATQQFAKQYGYGLPKNLERIAQSDELTNRTVRGLMDRHNTFVRGVSTNWDEINKKNPEILRHLEGKGFDLSTKEGSKAAAEYMTTHIPISTGYGRASLDRNLFNQGLEGLYTSNSIPTAEGYTYGQGYITKVKKPTDFSSVNRQDWIAKNNPLYTDEDDYRKINFFTTHESEAIANDIFKSSNPKYTSVEQKVEEVTKRFNRLTKNLDLNNPKDAAFAKDIAIDLEKVNKYKNILGKSKYENKLLRTERAKPVEYDNPFSFNSKLNDFIKSKGKDVMSSTKGTLEGEKLYEDVVNLQKNNLTDNKPVLDYLKQNHPDFFEPNKYAHYIHLGTPGEKVLEPIKSWEITPEIWKNKSRAHTNIYSKKLSALEKGGEITKDDNGYWNPENWGEPVEIGSNEITMKGLQEMGYNNPLLGVSDTGDTQMMYPGEDYTFDGESVTEYPVAQKGISVPAPTSADSLKVYNMQLAQDAYYNKFKNAFDRTEIKEYYDDMYNNPKSMFDMGNNPSNSLDTYRQRLVDSNRSDVWLSGIKKWHNVNNQQAKQMIANSIASTKNYNKDPNVIYYKDLVTGEIDPAAPLSIFDRRIKPQKNITRYPKEKEEFPGNIVEHFYYDPLAVKPYAMRTPKEKIEWEKKYGKPKPKPVAKATPKKEQPAKQVEKPSTPVVKTTQPAASPIVEKRQNIYEGSPVYSPGAGTGMGSALIGFLGQQGDTTYIKPEDYERFAVPKYGKEFIESKKKKNGGWLEKYN